MSVLTSRSPWDSAKVVATIDATSPAAARAEIERVAQNAEDLRERDEPAELLRKLAQALADRRAELVEMLIAEAGKVRADAEAEADLLPRKIDVTLDRSMSRTPVVSTAAFSAAGPIVVWRPRGVAVVLGPYNFPLHLLHGLVVPALATGCPVVAKPSERCPGLAALYLKCIQASGLSPYCAIVHGGRAVAEALVDHPATATVAAVGGRTMGLALARRLAARPEVVLALELGGVNPAIVLDDADTAGTVAAVAEGAWRMAGQRCTATRIVHVPATQLEVYLPALIAERSRWIPGRAPEAAAGPMIAPDAREAFQRPFRSLPPGLSLLAGSPQPMPAPHDSFCDPLLLLVNDRRCLADPLLVEEHFGPALIVVPFRDLDDCIRRCAANPYRLSASVFTASIKRFKACAARLPYGQVNHNRPTAGARSELPFGGCGLSGNGRPAAVAATAIFADETVVWPNPG